MTDVEADLKGVGAALAEELKAAADPSISQWEFVDVIPTREQVIALLETLPPVFGIRPVDFADYVQGLPSTKKVKVPREGGRGKEEVYHDVVTLYMSVAGRLKMIQAAAELNDWRVDFEPEPGCSPPGMLSMEKRIVYREYVSIWRGDTEHRIGRKPGMAWVPESGGSAAAGSNPYEKVETAARGRAIAAWGFGVLPGSGVASLEEMLGATSNRQAVQQEGAAAAEDVTMSRDELLAQMLTLSEEVRQARDIDPQEQMAKTAEYVKKTFGTQIAIEDTDENGTPQVESLDWSKVKDGQLLLLTNQLRSSLKKIRTEEARV